MNTPWEGFEAPPPVEPNIDPARLYGYRLQELDRAAGSLTRAFVSLDGKGPMGMLAEIYARQGGAVVLDAGCGTGNQLYSLISDARLLYGVDETKIEGDGVSDYNFSGLSQNPKVEPAFRTRRLKYHVGDIAAGLPRRYDVAYSYEVLMHNADPGSIVLSLWRSLKDGGVAYFNIDAEQQEAIDTALTHVKSKRGEVLEAEQELPVLESIAQAAGRRRVQTRRAYRIAKSPTEPWLGGVLDVLRSRP